MFTDWRGDPDELPRRSGHRGLQACSAAAARRGVVVKGLVWRSHLDRFAFSEQENRHLGEEIEAAGGECLRDMRVRPGGSHHQKLVVLRHPGRPELDVAFVGRHRPVPQPQRRRRPPRRPATPAHGRGLRRPPAVARRPVRGARARGRRPRGDVPRAVDRPRAAHPQPVRPADRRAPPRGRPGRSRCPRSCPTRRPCGTQSVQVLRTYPAPRQRLPVRAGRANAAWPGPIEKVDRPRAQPDLPGGSVLLGRRASCAASPRAAPRTRSLRLIAVIPHSPRSGRPAGHAAEPGRPRAGAGRAARRRWRSRRGVRRREPRRARRCTSTPRCASSTTCGPRSARTTSTAARGRTTPSCPARWSTENCDEREPRASTVSATVRACSRATCGSTWRASISTATDGDDGDLLDPESAFEQFARSAQRLQDWHDGGRRGEHRRDGCVPTGWNRSPGALCCGPSRCTGRSTTRTAARCACVAATRSDRACLA